MELKLNIYGDEGEVVKTYTSHEFDLMTGTCEDILKAVDIDKIMASMNDSNELGKEIIRVVLTGYSKFRPFIFRAFKGLTEEEFEHTKMKEVGQIITSIVIYTINELFSILGTPRKDGKEKKA